MFWEGFFVISAFSIHGQRFLGCLKPCALLAPRAEVTVLGTPPDSFCPWPGWACPSPAAESCSTQQCSYSWLGSNLGWINSILRNNSWQAHRNQLSKLECLFYMPLITSSCAISLFFLLVVLGQVVVWKSEQKIWPNPSGIPSFYFYLCRFLQGKGLACGKDLGFYFSCGLEVKNQGYFCIWLSRKWSRCQSYRCAVHIKYEKFLYFKSTEMCGSLKCSYRLLNLKHFFLQSKWGGKSYWGLAGVTSCSTLHPSFFSKLGRKGARGTCKHEV